MPNKKKRRYNSQTSVDVNDEARWHRHAQQGKKKRYNSQTTEDVNDRSEMSVCPHCTFFTCPTTMLMNHIIIEYQGITFEKEGDVNTALLSGPTS